MKKKKRSPIGLSETDYRPLMVTTARRREYVRVIWCNCTTDAKRAGYWDLIAQGKKVNIIYIQRHRIYRYDIIPDFKKDHLYTQDEAERMYESALAGKQRKH